MYSTILEPAGELGWLARLGLTVRQFHASLQMSSPTPPPLPDRNSALRTYLRAGATLIPTVCFWLFARTVLVPKLEKLWQDAGLTGSRAQWLISISDAFQQNFYFIFLGITLPLLLAEFQWPQWPRYRRGAVAGLVVFFHTAVLFGITAIATAALSAAPLLLKNK